MSIFSKLKKAVNPGGAIVSAIAGNGKNYIGPLDYAMDSNKTPKPPPPIPFDPGQRVGASINGQSGVDQPSMRLGWTNGGYQYHNSPFNMGGGAPPPPRPHDAPGIPPAPTGPAMSFGGGMGMSGPKPMLQPAPNGASMPPAGAPAGQGTPTAPSPEMIRAIMLRNGGQMM